MLRKNVLSFATAMLLVSTASAETTLEELVVTSKSNKKLIDVAGSTTVITAEEIKKMGADSIEEVISESVGISSSVNEASVYGRKNISIRGLESRRTIILLNGRNISGADALVKHSDFQYNWIPMNAIEKIEIVRGPMSSLYGSNGLSGVINIITKKPTVSPENEIDMRFGSHSDTSEGRDNNFSFISGGQLSEEFAYTVFAQMNDKNPESEEDDATSTLFEGKNITNVMLNAWIYDNLELSIVRSDESRDGVETSYDGKIYDITKEHYSVAYTHEFENFDLKTNIYRTASDSKYEAYSNPYTHELSNNVFNAEVSTDMFDNHFIVAGAEYRKEKYAKTYESTSSNAFEDSMAYKSAYVQDEIELFDDYILTLGARYDHHESFGSEFSPKAYLVYKLADDMRIKGGYGRGFNSPNIAEISDSYENLSFHDGSMVVFKGNSELQPETSDSYEIGFEYLTNDELFAVTAFYNDVENLITHEDTGDLYMGFASIRQYENVDQATTQGIEVEYSKDNILKDLDFDINYTYLKTEDKETNLDLTFKPKHTLNTKLSYMLPHEINSSLRHTYTGEQYNTENKEVGSYSTLGMQLSKEFTPDLSVRFGIENLTDKELSEDHEFQLRSRFYYIGLNYKF